MRYQIDKNTYVEFPMNGGDILAAIVAAMLVGMLIIFCATYNMPSDAELDRMERIADKQ